MSTRDTALGPGERVHEHKSKSYHVASASLTKPYLLIWKRRVVAPKKWDGGGDHRMGDASLGSCFLQEAKFAVVLEEDLDIAVDFFR